MNIYKTVLKTPIGYLLITASNRELISVNFITCRVKSELSKTKPEILKAAEKQLIEYFSGKRKKFNIKLKYEGTEFQKKVWKQLKRIPYGKTMSYKDIAKLIGKPKSARAIGNANNKNKIPIIIPCHRVISSNDELSGYGGGAEKKEYLLQFEREMNTVNIF